MRRVALRFEPALQRYPGYAGWLTDPDDWVINASNKSVNALVNPLFLGADLDFKQPPPHVRDLIAESEREHGYLNLTCQQA